MTKAQQAATTPHATVMAAYHFAPYSIVRYLHAKDSAPASSVLGHVGLYGCDSGRAPAKHDMPAACNCKMRSWAQILLLLLLLLIF